MGHVDAVWISPRGDNETLMNNHASGGATRLGRPAELEVGFASAEGRFEVGGGVAGGRVFARDGVLHGGLDGCGVEVKLGRCSSRPFSAGRKVSLASREEAGEESGAKKKREAEAGMAHE